MYINILILVFCLLLGYQLYLAFSNKTIEGLEDGSTTYADYDTNDPNNALILSQQNAGNISYLKQRVDELASLKETVDNLTTTVDGLSTQIDDLVQQQADYGAQLAGDTPADISGTTDDDTTTPEDTTTTTA